MQDMNRARRSFKLFQNNFEFARGYLFGNLVRQQLCDTEIPQRGFDRCRVAGNG